MRVAPLRWWSACVLALACAVLLPVPASGAGADAGRVHFVQEAGRSFDHFTRSGSSGAAGFIRAHYARMTTFSPYFDRHTRWYPRAWAYLDLYGIKPGSRVARRHPDWILRGRRGNRLYIPFDCSRRRCARYAGDITNRGFQRWWIRHARRVVRRGYIGLYLDNVNMIRRVALGNGREVTPYRARSRRRISKGAWRRSVARWTRKIRRSIPRRKEIVHNVIWFSPRSRDRWSRLQVRSASVIALERGINDAGLTGDNGRWGLPTFLRYVDWLHRRRRPVFFNENHAPTAREREYGLAGYLLINEGRDYLGSSPFSLPTTWWRGYDVELGAPLGRRYSWQGLIRRDFQRGVVILNRPRERTRTVQVPGSWRSADGHAAGSTVTLGPSSAAILRRR